MSIPRGRLGLKPGTQGSQISILTNSFEVTRLPGQVFEHYDEFPSFDKMPKRDRCLMIYDKLMIQNTSVFSPRAVYDGQKNMFTARPLKLPNNAAVFDVNMSSTPSKQPTNPKAIIRVKITLVAKIDPKKLKDILDMKGSHNSETLTALTLLNVLIRMKPILSNPSNANSFYTRDFRNSLGKGLELWRGLFQSVRPTVGRLLINIDIATTVMYSAGPLIETVLAFLGSNNARDLVRLTEIQKRKLDSFLKGLLVGSNVPPRQGGPIWRKIQEVVTTGADDYEFYNEKTGETTTITKHFQSAYRHRLQLGKAICINTGKGAVYPIEVLEIKPAQIYKKMLPPELAPQALKFSTVKPADRMRIIQTNASLLGYTDSDFLQYAGMTINQSLISLNARVLSAPAIQWGSSHAPDTPRGGAWNVVGKKLWQPAKVRAWSVVNYDHRRGQAIFGFLRNFVEACKALGMLFPDAPPEILPGTRKYDQDMEEAAKAAIGKFRETRPSLIFVVLPDSALDIRIAVKKWGDCLRGCPTQCMKSGKLNGNNQYCNNLALKLNVKLGGVNSIPAKDVPVMKVLSSVPTMIIGADVSHASPYSDRPSVAGVVSSVDQFFSRYVASTNVQTARQEIITDLDEMVENAVRMFFEYWKHQGQPCLPKRIIFFRDGVSEGQFEIVGKEELNSIKACLSKLWREKQFGGTPPTITFIIVGKRHHIRFFPKDSRDADKSGNCPAGMVVDREIVSPVDYDFYLQSHGGLLGTSRPSHYSIIEDGNNLGADNLQAISYLLCHCYARATRSVSIPAPVYYADIVCARGNFHSDLIHGTEPSAGGNAADLPPGEITLAAHKKAYKGIAPTMQNYMYFM